MAEREWALRYGLLNKEVAMRQIVREKRTPKQRFSARLYIEKLILP
jgi:hypothetical protein